MPQAGQPTPAVAQPQQPGAGAPTEQAERKEYLPEDGYDDDTIASLQHAGFWPGRTMEWVTLAASDPQAFAQSINKLDPVQRLAITKAVQNKAR
jgi:hypothetical protein